jgi:hypothetical protein
MSKYSSLFFICLSLALILVVANSCASLKYEPVVTPVEKQEDRKKEVEKQLKSEFSQKKLKYTSYGFGKSSLLKPPSHFTLDSLYEIKYLYEKGEKGLSNSEKKSLDENIQFQRIYVQNDTLRTYFIEDHVFTVQDSALLTTFHVKLYVDKQNHINTMEVIDSYNLPRELIATFSVFAFKESILYSHLEPDDAELAFYELYENQLDQLSGNKKEEFLVHMLKIMKTIKKIRNLEKYELIKEEVRQNAQGNARNYFDERFVKVEEIRNATNELKYYYIVYKHTSKNADNESELRTLEIYLDPFLQLVELVSLK